MGVIKKMKSNKNNSSNKNHFYKDKSVVKMSRVVNEILSKKNPTEDEWELIDGLEQVDGGHPDYTEEDVIHFFLVKQIFKKYHSNYARSHHKSFEYSMKNMRHYLGPN